MNKPCSVRSKHAGTIAGAVAALFAAAVAQSSYANPTGAQVVSGAVTVNSPSAGQMNITQGTPNAIVNWNTFSIGANEAVTIAQPSAASALLNRVVGNDASVIAGRLQANGRVFLVNPAGVIFAPGSSVNVGSMIASTLNVSDGDFLAGHYRFVGASAAPVSNAGTLSAQAGGTIALLGGAVSNTGTVSARLGTVALGAGSDITVDFAGDGLTTLKIDRGAANALVGNAGTLAADGGLVVMSAQTADALAGTVLNQQGIVRARSVAERDGRIVLDGGATGVALVGGTLDATGGAGLTGGRIDVTGHDVALLAGARVDASGAAGGGTVRVGGGARGADPTLRNADALWMSPDAIVRADALDTGNGGHLVAYSDRVSRLYGTLSARGGPQGGNGGFIETSSHALDTTGATIDASARHGASGTWLLDPYEVDIVAIGYAALAMTPASTVEFGPYTSTTSITSSAIENVLNQGTSVTVSTSPSSPGDINVFTPIAKTGGGDAVLTLSASGSVAIFYSIGSTSGMLGVVLDANVGGNSPGSSVSINGASISTNGGDLLIGSNALSAVNLSSATIATQGGNVRMNIGGTGTAGAVNVFGSTIDTQGGNLQMSGAASSGDAVALAYSLITTGNGNVSVAGSALDVDGGTGVDLMQSSIATTGGSIAITGAATGQGGGGAQNGVQISGGYTGASGTLPAAPALASTGGGGISISGSANGQFASGIGIGNTTVSTTTGTIAMSGDAIGGSGSAGQAVGVSLSGASLASTTGAIALSGSGSSAFYGNGVQLFGGYQTTQGNATVVAPAIASTGGAITVTGSALAPSGTGITVGSGTRIVDTSGALTMTGSVTPPASASGSSFGATGISLLPGASIETGSGDVTLTGSVPSTADVSVGLDVNSASIASTSGAITLTGASAGAPSAAASVLGVLFENNSDGGSTPPSVTTGSGTLRINGSGTGPQAAGVLVADGATITSTGGGAIDIRGAVAGPAASGTGPNLQNDYGVVVVNGSVTATGATGAISIAGSTTTSDAGVAFGAVPGPGASLNSFVAGPVTISTANPGTIVLGASNDGSTNSLVSHGASIASPGGTLVVMPASVDPSNGFAIVAQDATPITLLNTGAGLSIDGQTFQTFSSTFQTMVFGSSTQTGRITVNGQCASSGGPCVPTRPEFSTNLTLSNPGAGSQGIDLPAGISLPGHTLTLESAGPVTDPGGIQAAGLLLAGPGSFVLTDPQNAVGVLAMAGAGNVDFLNSGSFAIGPIVSKTYDPRSGQLTTIDATHSTLTGNLTARAATGNISLGGGTPAPNGPTGGLNTNLTAGGSVDLVMENGVFTDAGTGTITAGNAWRIWALTWAGETRGNVQPNTALPNFYGCLFGAGCSWGGVVPTTGNHFVYVGRPTLTVTAGDAARPALTPNPPFGYTVSGLINGDSPGSLIGTLSTPATLTSPIGTYPIDPNFASSVGYIVNQVPGTLTVLPVLESQLPLAQSGLQSFFGNSEQTFVYENNLQGTNVCIGMNQPLFTTALPGEKQDLLAIEWKRVRQQPNLNSCMLTTTEHGCGDF